MRKSNNLFKIIKKKEKEKKKENNILCWDRFKQVLVRYFINLEKQSATHNNHWRQFTIHLNEDWTEAPFLSLKLKWRFKGFFFFSFLNFPFHNEKKPNKKTPLHCLFTVYPLTKLTLFLERGTLAVTMFDFKLKYARELLDSTGY